jgi:RNA polymerase sigma-70 factor (ECF subfamily)
VEETDLALVRRMLSGDESAFTQCFDEAYPVLFRFALVRLRFDRDAAGDVAQTAICKAFAKLDTFRGEAALLTWLCSFCRRELSAHYRQHGRRQEVEFLEDDPEIRAALEALRVSAADDLDESLDRRRAASVVQRVLDHLPPHYADALEWKYIDELPVQEIGIRLGVGAKAAESLLSRARRAFREAFLALPPAWAGSHHGRG